VIPNIVPPPLWLPQGWSPNALKPTDAAIVQTVLNGGGLFSASLQISNAQLNALSVTPLTIVAGQPNIALYPVQWSVKVLKTVASGGPSTAIRLRWLGVATDLCAALSTDLANARSFFATGANAISGLSFVTAAGFGPNLALRVDATAAGPFGGSDATLNVDVSFYQVPLTNWV